MIEYNKFEAIFYNKWKIFKLINEVEKLVSEHPTSTGLSLNTEVEANINFYLHLGFKLIGQAKVGDDITTWGFLKLSRNNLLNLFCNK